MSTERLVRDALENSVMDLSCPEPDLEQLLAAGRAAERRRVVTTASLAVAAVLVVVLAGLSFAWAGKAGRALEPVPANSSATRATVDAGIASPLQQWIDALPAGAPPATPYWHDGTLYVNGVQIPARYGAVDIQVAGQTVLVAGHQNNASDRQPQWALVRGDRLEPLRTPASARQILMSVDGRIAYWMVREMSEGTTRFFTWDTETNTALSSRTVPGTSVELHGIDAVGNAYWQDLSPLDPITRWDVRADTIHPSDLAFDPALPPELFDGFVPWMNPADAYRSPDGTQTLITDSVPRENPSMGIVGDTRLRARPAGPDDSVDPQDITTLSLSTAFPNTHFLLGYGNGYWVWWESNESVLLAIDGDLRSYLVRCPADGGDCQRVADLGTDTAPEETYFKDWRRAWGFARAPIPQ